MKNTKKLILVVDDIEESFQIIAKMLKSLDVELSYACSGKEAIASLDIIQPDLIILDILMPEMNGFDVCRCIKRREKTKNIPILFLSAKNTLDDIVNGFNLGAADYLTKPVIKEELFARVKLQLSLKQKSDELIELNRDLENRIDIKTSELVDANEKLKEYNTTLKLVLENKNEKTEEMKCNIIHNFSEVCVPQIRRLKKSKLTIVQRQLLDIIENSINDAVSPFTKNINSVLMESGVTQRELEVVHLIMQGLSSSEIADILNLAETGVAFHRKNIRKKLNLSNSGANLYIYLKSLMN